MNPCVFFDRDGIVNQCPGAGYVESVKDFIVQRGFLDALRVVNQKGYTSAIVTNQRGVGKGIVPLSELETMHNDLRCLLAEEGLHLDGIYSCTTADPDSPLRKPRPGLLLQAAEELGIELTSSWMIGDRETDVQAGLAAGCRTILVAPHRDLSAAHHRLHSMKSLPDLLEGVL